ncbi:S-adenosylmethionine decarboxylase [Paenibacillus filicis]|uniref:S-adenosylmethionine decarboxylase n=1 Tax=Paenibacillus gyeongsangnamensis TaxID=3388067 RepID=A0ABT4Q8W7_9BACL|nr:S-adenosylmethionine decarboxylase [Paenibacillus filicis]MCZ8513323.1 S-adenosylmethionine decarboxylase [Paenibacillus filicis]
MRKWRKKGFMYAIVVVLVVWPIFQVVHLLGKPSPVERPDKLLYQVSLFQMELLGSYLQTGTKSQTTDGLNALRQAVYSAQFAHDHLILAYGEARLTKLDSLSDLMQYILRLQVGGGRQLRADESQALNDVNNQFAVLYDAYSKLLSSGGDIVSSQNSRLQEADKSISLLLKRKLLQ